MVATTPFARPKTRESTQEAFDLPLNDNKTRNNVSNSDIEISKRLFDLIPCNSRLRYCVDIGSRNGEHFVDDTPIAHSLLVEDHEQHQGHKSMEDNDHQHGQNTWFGVLLQPDESAFQSLRRLHDPLGNLCLQISPSVEDGAYSNESLDCILKKHVSELPSDFDLLGLYEAGFSNYWVLRNFLGSAAYRPKVVCISYDNRRPNDVAYIPDRNNKDELPSISAIMDVMMCYDYQLVETTARCCFFATQELYEGFLRYRMLQRVGEIPTVPQHFETTGSRFVNNQQYPEKMMTNVKQSKILSSGIDGRSESLGGEWLVQRRQIFDSGDPTTAVSSHPDVRFDWQSRINNEAPITESSLEEKKIKQKDEIGNQKTEEKSKAHTLSGVPNDQFPENGSLLELKNEILKLRQEKQDFESDIHVEGPETNEIDDAFSARNEPLDLTAICDPIKQSSEVERSECSKMLVAELQRNGYAMVRGTSISRFICTDALYASHILLYEADESVRSSCQSQTPVPRGYTAKCTERSSSGGLTDMVRKFRLGSDNGNITNIWPLGEMMDNEADEYVRNSFQKYHDNLRRVAISITKSVHEAFACNIGESHMTKPMNSPFGEDDPNTSLLTVFNCEHGTRHETMKPLIASHNDSSLVTMLLLDSGNCATIQHEVSEGNWESVKMPSVVPFDPIFIVYAGENLQKLSGGLISSKARRIVPSLGDLAVNGLSFSLMPSDGRTYPSRTEEPTRVDQEVLPNPISKIASELNYLDEMFRSFVLAEDDDKQFESDYEDNFDEDFEWMMDPFPMYDHEDARDTRKRHMHSNRVNSRPSRASDPIRREKAKSSRRKENSSRRATIGGEARDDKDLTMRSESGKDERHDNDRRTQLLGSSQLPIVIETKKDTEPKEIIITPLVETPKNVEPNRGARVDVKRDDRVDSKCLLPLAPAWNPPGQESNQTQSNSYKARKSTTSTKTRHSTPIRAKPSRSSTSPMKTRKATPTKIRPIKPILYDENYTGREYGESKDEGNGLTQSDAFRARFELAKKTNTLSRKVSRLDLEVPLEENSIRSSDASAILDEILGDRKTKASIEQTLERRKLQQSQPRPILNSYMLWEERGYKFGCENREKKGSKK